jgi:hypothetical protein
VIWLAMLALAILVAYLILLIIDTRRAVSQAPRTDMLTCDKHGPFPKSCAIQLTGATAIPVEYCPFCLHEKLKGKKEK